MYNKYIDFEWTSRLLSVVSIVSAVLLMVMPYDSCFRITIILPLFYLICLNLLINKKQLMGIGSVSLVVMYGFRMCILPILCAYGNFYIEPSRYLYLSYYPYAILLMCFECVWVLGLFRHYSKRFENELLNTNRYSTKTDNNSNVLYLTVVDCAIVYAVIYTTHPSFLTLHLSILFSEVEESSTSVNSALLQSYGSLYYLLVIMDLVARPLLSFYIVDYLLRKESIIFTTLALLVGIGNVFIITDRRILSFLVGACCVLQIYIKSRGKNNKRFTYLLVVILALMTVYYCFYGEDTSWRIARKFQRYFSGPSLTAIGIGVCLNYSQTPLSFVKLLFNDSIILTGLFGTLDVPNYVIDWCGSSGRSIWTPMMIGSIQYFGVLGPLVYLIPIRYIVGNDYRAANQAQGVRKQIYNYLSLSIAVYLTMYTVELVIYNIIAIGGFFKLLLWLSQKVRITFNGKRLKN